MLFIKIHLLEAKNVHLYSSTVQFYIKINHLASKANFENFVRWMDGKTHVCFTYHTVRTSCACSCPLFHVWKVHSSTMTYKSAPVIKRKTFIRQISNFSIHHFPTLGIELNWYTYTQFNRFYVFTSLCLVRPYPPLPEMKSFSFCFGANFNSRLEFLPH